MFGSDLYIALVVGVILSLIFAEKTGIIPAGMVVPDYLALVFDQPIFIAVIFVISILLYVIVQYGLFRITLLYGRRKIVAMLTVGILMKLFYDVAFDSIHFVLLEY